MKIEDEFRVPVPVEQAWNVLLDVERIAPCMPGAQLQEIEGDEYRGIVKVKVGPITAQYKGAARITEADEANRRIVIAAEGRDTRGQGNASATVTATLTADGEGTVVVIDTDLTVTGKVAQFGRGVMAEVSSKLLAQFAESLRTTVLSGEGTTELDDSTAATESERAATGAIEGSAPVVTTTSDATGGGAVRTIDAPEAEPVDLLGASSGALARRIAPIVVAVLALLTLRSLRKRRKRRKAARRTG